MKDSYEISKADDSLLLTTAKKRISSHPHLQIVYDDKFLQTLIQSKRDPDNLLLFWLVNENEFDSPTSKVLLKEMEKMLEIFANSNNFESLKLKLRQWHTIPFESTVTELDFAYEYFKRGYVIELEPCFSNNRKGDFSATNADRTIFFEVKLAYKETSKVNKAIIDELSRCCRRTKHKFYIENIDVDETFQRTDLKTATKFIEEKLQEFKKTDSSAFPCTLYYPNKETPLIKIDIKERLQTSEGFVGMYTYGGGITNKWADLRRKIEDGVSQLHPDFPGVIIFRPYGLDYLEYDIKNALCGDLSISFGRNSAETKWFRTGDRIFSPSKNSRLSVVVVYDKRLQNNGYTRRKIVYHNPFAIHKLPAEVFDGENVTQHFDPC